MEEIKPENLQTKKTGKFGGLIPAIIAIMMIGVAFNIMKLTDAGWFVFFGVTSFLICGAIGLLILATVLTVKNIKGKNGLSLGTMIGLAIIITILIFSFWMFGFDGVMQWVVLTIKLPFYLLMEMFK